MPEHESTIQNDLQEQMVTFKLGNEEYGVNILQVQEINRMVDITAVPHTAEYVKGIINLRGKVIPVIDLRAKIGLENREYDNQSRIVVVEVSEQTLGLIVDSVSEVLRVNTETLEDAPSMISGKQSGSSDSGYIKSIVKMENRLLFYLDLEKIVSTCELPS